MGYQDPRYGQSEQDLYVFSASNVETARMCMYKFYLTTTQTHPIISRVMAIGSGVSKGADLDNKNKMVRGEPKKKKEIVECAVEGYRGEVEEAEIREDPDMPDAKAIDATAAAATRYAEDVSPTLKKIRASEQRLTYPIADGIELAGTPDVITDEGIGDFKTGKKWTQDKADQTDQLTAYMILHYREFGEYPSGMWIDSLSPNRGQYKHTRIPTWRTERDFQALVATIQMMVKALKSGIFMPTSQKSWWCSPKFCQFWHTCPYPCRGASCNGK